MSSLVGFVQKPELDLTHNRAERDDILGGGREDLPRHFATESVSGTGQVYTPYEVSRVIGKVSASARTTPKPNPLPTTLAAARARCC